jgi:hypothetical protein
MRWRRAVARVAEVDPMPDGAGATWATTSEAGDVGGAAPSLASCRWTRCPTGVVAAIRRRARRATWAVSAPSYRWPRCPTRVEATSVTRARGDVGGDSVSSVSFLACVVHGRGEGGAGDEVRCTHRGRRHRPNRSRRCRGAAQPTRSRWRSRELTAANSPGACVGGLDVLLAHSDAGGARPLWAASSAPVHRRHLQRCKPGCCCASVRADGGNCAAQRQD